MAKFQHGSLIFGKNIESLNADKILQYNSDQLQFLEPLNSLIKVCLPNPNTCIGSAFWIINTSDDIKLNICTDTTSLISILDPNDITGAFCDGVSWKLDKENYLKQLDRNCITVEDDYDILSTDDIILVNCSTVDITVTLPDPAVVKKTLTIKKIDNTSNNVNILPYNLEVIDGQNSKSITSQYDHINVNSNGTNWYII